MKKKLISALIAVFLITGCEKGSVSSELGNKAVPPEVNQGGGSNSIFDALRIYFKIKINVCWGGHPDCEDKPSKEQTQTELQNFNVVLQQVNTYSTPINNKAIVEVVNGNQVMHSQVFDVVVVGNQIRMASPSAVADWLHPKMEDGTEYRVGMYMESTGFADEYVTVQARINTEVVSAASFLVEIDCGENDPHGSPEQGCVILP